MAIAFDSVSSGSVGGTPGITSMTISHTVNTNSNSILTFGVAVALQTTTGVTYNGVAMSLIAAQTFLVTSEVSIWRLLAPATGAAHNIVATFSGSVAGAAGGGVAFTGVDQTTPIGATNTGTGTGTSASTAVTTTVNNSWVLDAVGNVTSDSETVGASQTQRWNQPGINNTGAGSTVGPVSPTASTTMSWTNGASLTWAQVVIELLPSPAAGGNFFPFFRA